MPTKLPTTIIGILTTLLACSLDPTEARAAFFLSIKDKAVWASRTKLAEYPTQGAYDNSNQGVYDILSKTEVVDPRSGESCPAIDTGLFNVGFNSLVPFWQSHSSTSKALVVIMPQFGDFDTFEYARLLAVID